MSKTNQSNPANVIGETKVVNPEYSITEHANGWRHKMLRGLEEIPVPSSIEELAALAGAMRKASKSERTIIFAESRERESKGAEKFNNLELAGHGVQEQPAETKPEGVQQ